MLKVRHNITKKIDQSGNLVYFFDVLQRPKSALVVDVATELPDGTRHQTRLGVAPMTATERQLAKTGQARQFGWFSIEVPSLERAVSFTVEAHFGLLAHKHSRQVVQPSDRFEDVTALENQIPDHF